MKPILINDQSMITVVPVPDMAEPVAVQGLTISTRRGNQGVNPRTNSHRPGLSNEADNDNDQTPERQLFCEVITQALKDATGVGAGVNTKSPELCRDQAANWFKTNSKDFRTVCELAGFDPDAVRQRALAIIAKSEKDNPSKVERPKRSKTPKRQKPQEPRRLSKFANDLMANTALIAPRKAA